MKKENGFATSGILYTLLLLFVALLFGVLQNLQNKKTILDTLKTETINALACDCVTMNEEILKNKADLQNLNNQVDDSIRNLHIEYGTVKLEYAGTGFLGLSGNNSITLEKEFSNTNYMVTFTINADHVSSPEVRNKGTSLFVYNKSNTQFKISMYNAAQNYTTSDWVYVDWIAIGK